MLSALVLLFATGFQGAVERPPTAPKPPQGEPIFKYPGQGDHPLNYHPGDPLQPISEVEGWFEPVESVYQDDADFTVRPGNLLRRVSLNSWYAGLHMVAGKSTVITGILGDSHDKVIFKGKSNGAEWSEVKLRLWLSQNGTKRLVYDSGHAVGAMRVAGSRAAPTNYDIEIPAGTGLPEVGSSYQPFKIGAGSYGLTAELDTMDGKSTGAVVYLDGECSTTVPPSVYILPAVLTAGRGGMLPPDAATLASTAVTLATNLSTNASAATPVKDGGFPVFALPLQDFSRFYSTTMRQWALQHENDVDIDPSATNDFVTNAIGAKLANFEDVLGRLGGNAKVLGLLSVGDFNRTNKGSTSVAAFTKSQKAIVMQEPYARWTIALHEVNHASSFLWSDDQMKAEYGLDWHNTHDVIASGVKILASTRKKYTNAETIMNGSYFNDDSESRWITMGTYDHLLTYYQSGGDPAVIDIHGQLLMGKTKEACILEPGYTLTGVPDPLSTAPSNGYSISLKDKGCRSLATYGFVPGYDAGDVKTNVGTFTVRLALPPGAASFSVVGPHGVLTNQNLSSVAPSLRVTSGATAVVASNRTVHLAWAASSADKLPLQYTVLYSENGTVWAPASVEQTGSDVTFTWGLKPTAFSFKSGNRPVVRIFATDGTRSSSVDVPVSGI